MLLILAIAAAVAGGPAQGQPSAATEATQPAPPSADDDLNKVVCRTEEVTGSRFNRRVCMTKAQWRDKEQKAQDFEHMLDSKQGLSGPVQGPMGG